MEEYFLVAFTAAQHIAMHMRNKMSRAESSHRYRSLRDANVNSTYGGTAGWELP